MEGIHSIKEFLIKQRSFFNTGATREVSFRRRKLEDLRQAIIENEPSIIAALKTDLGKAEFEAYATEIGIVLDEIRYALKHLASWAKPRKVPTPLAHYPGTSFIYPEPYGIVLIMAPWNYPFQLVIAPLIGAIAAGNCVVIKPSEYAPATAAVVSRLLRDSFEPEYIAVIEGGQPVSEALLKEQFDYIFFTGSVKVGKLVMSAAAQHLTPVTLELGGKSPCIVDRENDLDLAARRIVWGKFLNAGQTCVAPDYLLVHEAVKSELVKGIIKWINGFYGADPLSSPDYPRIINQEHLERLRGLLKGANIISGGGCVPEKRFLEPTVIDGVNWNDPVMQEEIFGPILPILTYRDLGEAITAVNSNPKPLALYFFSENKRLQQRVLKEVSFGGGCLNDTIVHLATPYLPFGGVGSSGTGGYHGQATFATFSHYKSILKKSTLVEVPVKYPPYRESKLKLLRWILR